MTDAQVWAVTLLTGWLATYGLWRLGTRWLDWVSDAA